MHARGLAVVMAALLAVSAGVALAAHKTISRQSAKSVAASIVLRSGDLPSYKGSPAPITADEERIDAQLAKCTGTTPDSAAWAKVQSPNFDSPNGGAISVGSTAIIQASAATGAHDLKAINQSKTLDCYGTQLRSQLVAALAGKATLVSLKGSKITSVVSGSDGTFAFRFAFVLAVKQGKKTIKVPAYGDFVGFAWGQAEISLSVESEFTPLPAALEKQLAARLVSRARAAIG